MDERERCVRTVDSSSVVEMEVDAGCGDRRGSPGTDRRHAFVPSPLGDLLVAAEGPALCGLFFSPHKYAPDIGELGPQVSAPSDPVFAAAAAELGEYFASRLTEFTVPVAARGDAFSESVWRILTEIPCGATRSYGDIAEQLGNRSLAQRVGQCVGHNPVSIVIPCHRVVGSGGELTGYAGGLERKRRLLAIEEPPAEVAGRLF